MINIAIIWFKNLSKTKKVFVTIVALLSFALSVQSARLARSEYKRLKSIEKEYNEAKKQVEESEAKELEIVKRNNTKTKLTSNKNQSINTKLKEDEKIIDNDSVSNNDLLDFITKHENRD